MWQARVARIERDRARAEAHKAEQISRFLQQAFAFADPSWTSATPNSGGRDARVVDLLASAGPRVDRELRDAPEVRAVLSHTAPPRTGPAQEWIVVANRDGSNAVAAEPFEYVP